MLRKLLLGPILGAVCLILGAANARAVNCSPNPFTLTPGTTASATQVMANFNNLLNCANTVLFGTGSGTIPAAQLPVPGSVNGGVSNPTGTTSTTAVMMGLGSAWTLTPGRSGSAMVMISGTVANSLGNNTGYFIKYGTGAAPANGAAATGASATSQVTVPNLPANGAQFALQAVVTGLTLGVPYWFDLAALTITTGATQFSNLNVSGLEN